MNGKVVGLTDIDPRGDTLTAPTLATDTVLSVQDIADFEEDTSDGEYWLTIAGSAPIEYLSIDEDANTITLAAAVGTAYEAGEPVAVWDPDANAAVAEYLVEVMTRRGSVPAILDHEQVPTAGVDSLVGASVTLDEDEDGDWYVDKILGRQTVLDPASIGSDLFRAHLAVNGGRTGGLNIPHDADTNISDWTVTAYDSDAFSYDGAGRLTLKVPGSYLSVVTVKWLENTSNRRATAMTTTSLGVDSEEVRLPIRPDDQGTAAHQVTLLHRTTAPNIQLRALVYQNTGAALGLSGNAAGTATNWRVLRLR